MNALSVNLIGILYSQNEPAVCEGVLLPTGELALPNGNRVKLVERGRAENSEGDILDIALEVLTDLSSSFHHSTPTAPASSLFSLITEVAAASLTSLVTHLEPPSDLNEDHLVVKCLVAAGIKKDSIPSSVIVRMGRFQFLQSAPSADLVRCRSKVSFETVDLTKSSDSKNCDTCYVEFLDLSIPMNFYKRDQMSENTLSKQNLRVNFPPQVYMEGSVVLDKALEVVHRKMSASERLAIMPPEEFVVGYEIEILES